jgi:AraC-like DNA-binding protein
MIARRLLPGPPLAGLVDCLWYYDGYFAAHQRERALPTGTVELVINLGEDRIRVFQDEADLSGAAFRGAVVCGAHSRYFVLDPAQQRSVIGVHFRPGGAAAMLGVPAGELANRHFGLEDIWSPPAARDLRQRLVEASDADARFAILESALVGRLQERFLPQPSVRYALRRFAASPTGSRVGDVRRETGYGANQFIALFRDSVGLSPKVYCRIRRFQAVIRDLSRARRVEWAAVAADSGYCDQSHLSREFRAFSGGTPGDYRAVAEDRPNHTLIEG